MYVKIRGIFRNKYHVISNVLTYVCIQFFVYLYLLIPTSSEINDFLEKFPLKRHLSLNVNLVSLNNHHIEGFGRKFGAKLGSSDKTLKIANRR
jgi:hypothetical protein